MGGLLLDRLSGGIEVFRACFVVFLRDVFVVLGDSVYCYLDMNYASIYNVLMIEEEVSMRVER